MRKPLQVMKFGGTSVGDASCIKEVACIIRNASRDCSVAVVVSAMGGVTNRLIEAAIEAKAGNETAVADVFVQLRKQHGEVVTALIHSPAERKCLQSKLHDLFTEGERLCAPLVAAALAEIGVGSEAIDATELVVTDSYHGAAEPWIDLTRVRCQARMAPLLEAGIVPVVTGFIGANEEGVLTTLGRGGSDYSATILG